MGKDKLAAAKSSIDQMAYLAVTIQDLQRNIDAIGGADLSATTDLTRATLIIRKPNDETVYVLQQYFLPESFVDRSSKRKDVRTNGKNKSRTWNR